MPNKRSRDFDEMHAKLQAISHASEDYRIHRRRYEESIKHPEKANDCVDLRRCAIDATERFRLSLLDFAVFTLRAEMRIVHQRLDENHLSIRRGEVPRTAQKEPSVNHGDRTSNQRSQDADLDQLDF